MKCTVVLLLEAVGSLMRAGYRPKRTLLFGFGQDEEVGGALGAARTAALLLERGGERPLEVIVDEGAVVLEDGLGRLRRPFALIGTAEKGYATVRARVTSAGGHSSMPPLDGSTVGAVVGRLLAAVDAHPPPAELVDPLPDFLRALAPLLPAWARPLAAAAAGARPLRALAARLLAHAGPEMAALVRTTIAPTRLAAGVADNVLPQSGEVSFNARLLPGHDLRYAEWHIASLVPARDLGRVTLSTDEGAVPGSAVSPAGGRWISLMARAIGETYRDAASGAPLPVLPFLLSGMTDSRNYASLSRNGVLRFAPLTVRAGELSMLHGTNERFRVSDWPPALCFYRRALEAFGSAGDGEAGEGAGGTDAATQGGRADEL